MLTVTTARSPRGALDEQTRANANELYWDSDASVGQIADDLGISRRALYDNIDPAPAGEDCPECGSPLGYRNRTAAERRAAECAECGLERTVERPMEAPARGAGGSAADRAGPATPEEEPEGPELERASRAARLAPVARRVPATGAGPLLSGAMLAGLAVGAAVGYVVRRR